MTKPRIDFFVSTQGMPASQTAETVQATANLLGRSVLAHGRLVNPGANPGAQLASVRHDVQVEIASDCLEDWANSPDFRAKVEKAAVAMAARFGAAVTIASTGGKVLEVVEAPAGSRPAKGPRNSKLTRAMGDEPGSSNGSASRVSRAARLARRACQQVKEAEPARPAGLPPNAVPISSFMPKPEPKPAEPAPRKVESAVDRDAREAFRAAVAAHKAQQAAQECMCCSATDDVKDGMCAACRGSFKV
jgi:hypothetical protein